MVQIVEVVKIGQLNLVETQFNNIYTSWYVYIYICKYTHMHTYIYTQNIKWLVKQYPLTPLHPRYMCTGLLPISKKK